MTFQDQSHVNADGIAPDARELVDLLNNALSFTGFQTRKREEISPEQLRRAFSGADGRTTEAQDTLTAEAVISDEHIKPLANHLRGILAEYITDDSIGHAFSVLGCGKVTYIAADLGSDIRATSRIPTFAKSVVRAAGCIGAERTAQLIHEWKAGQPKTFKHCIVLTGVDVDAPIELRAGVRLYQLPVSSEHLPNAAPDRGSQMTANILGRTVLEVDGDTNPVLYKPPERKEDEPPLMITSALDSIRVEELTAALSLACNRQVTAAWGWDDLQEKMLSWVHLPGCGCEIQSKKNRGEGTAHLPAHPAMASSNSVGPPHLHPTCQRSRPEELGIFCLNWFSELGGVHTIARHRR